jgi:four helix bundle protein
MVPYQELDAFKVSHELTLRVHVIVEQIGKRDAELAGQLWLAALFASGRIARGAAMGNRRMFAYCLDRTLGALSELGYHLNVARSLELLPEAAHREIEGLRGRATFYTTKLLNSLFPEPGTGSTTPP